MLGDAVPGVVRRSFALFAAFILTVATSVPAFAQTSDTVTVTGSIVAAPLSITISTESVSFGNIDYRSTQDGNSSATGFLTSDNNGAQWVANTPVSITVISPSTWTSTACVSSSSGLPGTGLYLLPSMPASVTEAGTAFAQANVNIPSNCSSVLTWKLNHAEGESTWSRQLGMWIQSTHTTGAFNATVTFSVSN
jgi:type 1 fimbria pilin